MYKQEEILRCGLKMLLTIMASACFHYNGSPQMQLSYGQMRVILGQVPRVVTNGYAILFTDDKAHFKQFPIAWCELYIVVVMLKTWCNNLTNNRITLHTDNQVVVHAINNGVRKTMI